ncbi:bifunctional glutathione transferase/peroxidase [Elasticomyces elasticus]|nr:bifunctional glutathione transferase/peroxidase [Elasticomyces elasticus]KAK4989863.1 bifunctional glutathione transferase/peroxidase [Elasticomyces elasticus]
MAEANRQRAKVVLHWLDKSRSQRILWLLEECKVDYELKIYKRQTDGLAPPELKKVHPLGKSPVIEIFAPGSDKSTVIAESGFMIEYLCEHFGPQFVPKRYADGKEGQIGGEAEEWLRYRYFMHYAEGSLMTLNILALFMGSKSTLRFVFFGRILMRSLDIRNSAVPFFIKPVTRGIADKVDSFYLSPNFKTHFAFLDSQVATSPNGGKFLCGEKLTGADILMSFPLMAAKSRSMLKAEQYPKLFAYVEMLEGLDGYKKAAEKIEDMTKEPFKAFL